MFRNVAFPSQGATLRGRLYLPQEGPDRRRAPNQAASRQPAPIVIMTHGTSATITMVADRYAEVLHAAGFAVLLYDHRNFGISDGEPRGEINPWVQARGYRDAIDYVCSLAEIDKLRVAIWGDSFSAGQVLVVAACDDRVKAIVSQTTACGPTMPPQDPDGALFASVKSTFQNGDVGTPELRDRSAAGGLVRSARDPFAAHSDFGLPMVHRIRRASRDPLGELGHTRYSENARAISPGHLRTVRQGPHAHDDCTRG